MSAPSSTAFASTVGAGGTVLEIGSAGGRDALALEERGLVVRRTDISPGFVELMRSQGYDADVLDPLTDDLGGPYDGVWASACLLHVAREDLPTVLRNLAGATRPGGALAMSLKEGDGEEWSVHGHVRAPRRFVYWREAPLRAVLADAGWRVQELDAREGGTGSRGSLSGPCNSERVRHTEFWSRMEEALGPAYHRAWARQFVMAELGGRTAQEALDAGIPPKQVWAAVWRALELPANQR